MWFCAAFRAHCQVPSRKSKLIVAIIVEPFKEGDPVIRVHIILGDHLSEL